MPPEAKSYSDGQNGDGHDPDPNLGEELNGQPEEECGEKDGPGGTQ